MNIVTKFVPTSLTHLNVLHNYTNRVPQVERDTKITQIQDLLSKNSHHFDTIDYIYVLSRGKHLVGVASMKDIFRAKPSQRIDEIMKTSIVKAHLTIKKEKLANKAVEHGLKAIPLVDDNDRFVGVVPSDEIQKILNKEINEDFQRLSGIIPHKQNFSSTYDITVVSSILHRTPWILVGVVGGILGARIISSFEGILTKNVLLAAFIPLVAYIANAVANQTQTLFIRDLALDPEIKFPKYAVKQIFSGSIIAIICLISVYSLITLSWNEAEIAFVVGVAVAISIFVANLSALIVPYVLFIFKKDPAIGSGPFTTTLQDILSIVIYFWVALILL